MTEPERAEERLPASEAEHWTLFGAMSDVVLTLDSEGRYLKVAPTNPSLLYKPPEDLVGKTLHEVFPKEQADGFLGHIHDALETQRPVNTEYSLRIGDEEVWFSGTVSPMEEDKVLYVARDITERKRAEEKLQRSETNLAEAQRLVHLGSWELDLATGEAKWSDESYRIFGLSPGEVELDQAKFMEFVHPADREPLWAALREALDWRSEYDAEYRITRPDGSERVVHTRGKAEYDDAGKPIKVMGTNHDVTERRKAEEALKESERYLRAVVGNVPVVLFALDRDGVFTLSEGKGLEALGLRPGEVVGRSVFEEYRDFPAILENVRRTLGGEEVVATVKVGEVVFEVFYSSLRDEGGEVVGVIGVAADVTERHALEGRLSYQAFHDPLTALPNRQLFVDRLGQALRRTRRRSGHKKVAVLFMDLDGFKFVNDSLGHGVGDGLLVALAERLRGCVRPEDTLARFGGDEFTVLVEDVEGPEDAVRVAERIAECLRQPFVVGESKLFVGTSIGIALGNASTKGPEEMLRDADTAMYRAKEEGSGYRLFESGMYERVLDRLGFENDLRRAIRDEEFVVHYQPIVSLADGGVRRVEALVRWEHPKRGLLNPDEFMPLAEETGLIFPVGEGVLKEACRQGQRWQEEHPRIPPLIVSVNLSARQLGHPDLVKSVEGVLRETGFEPSLLSLDVTETAYMKVLEGNTAILDGLKKLGVCISIDDFGVGYSSLAYLKRLPADVLKIDKSFIVGIGEDVEDTAIVQMVIDLAHTLGMEALAEGVESEGQAEQLKEMGCDHGQGFYFSKPLPAQAVEEFLTR